LLAGALALSGGALVVLPAAASATDGLFAPYTTHAPWEDAANVAIGDVTGDGRADIVATTDYSADAAIENRLWVYPQQSSGGLGAPTSIATQAPYGSEMAVALADVDEDGDLDAAVTTEAGVELFAQVDGSLTYTWTVPIEEGRDLELADVSGDGLADLVVNTRNGIEIWWQIAGDFMSAPTGRMLSSGLAVEVEVADVTGDGLDDVVSVQGRTVEVRAQQADHSFAAPVSYASGGVDPWDYVNGLALGDTNGDDLVDVHVSVGGNKPNSWVVTRFQLSDGTLAKPYVRESYDIPETLEVADVTGDGLGDLLTLHGGWNRMGVYDSTPGTALYETLYPIPYASHYDAKAMAIGDVSGDGRADVAIADYNHGLVLLRGAEPGADVTAPDTTITSGPPGTHQSRTATFGFAATEVSTFTCSLDGAAWTTCTSPMTYDGLSTGTHTFRVRATDAAGNTDASPATWTFTVDGPDTTITYGPSGTVRETSAMFAFSAKPTPAYFECSMDNAAWQRCTSQVTYDDLATGTTHTFRVRAVSGEGLVESTPATRIFTVEAAADLGLSLTATPDTVKRGSTLTYTARVSNAGPNAAENVVFTQGLPSGVRFESVSAALDAPLTTTASCSGSDTTVRCELTPALNRGDWLIVTVTATVTASKGTLSSTAVLTTPTWDLDHGNDSASAYTKVGGGSGKGR
jgi:uncharacterized repeat protein (TIGR01451 family)